MMAKRFKIRMPSFQCCRSKDISALTTDPLPPTPPPPSPSKAHHSSLRRHVSSAFRTTVGCGCRSRSTNSDEDRSGSSPGFHLEVVEEEDMRHVAVMAVCGASDGYDDVVSVPSRPPPSEKKKRRLKKKKSTLRFRMSTSSAESGLFSSESFDEIDDEETETLVSSSKSISTDDDCSSEFNPHLETISENPYNIKKKKKKKKKKKRNNVKQRKLIKTTPSPESESPARLSVFQRLIPCTVDGKVRESFAVVKKSEDPYQDFKRSMMEMIMEKQMFDEKDLEQLLHCLLSLNDREHHGVIVEAFSEIWQSLFCRRSTSRRSF